MAGQSIAQRATALLGPHHPGNPVVLPTGWDAWSPRLATDAGFAALAVGGHPSFLGADSLRQTRRRGHVVRRRAGPLGQIGAQMTAAVDVAVSVDVEDTVDSEGKRLP
jgi:2-methylisocitrate lyase-like PEP mutase family enzyme